MFRFGKLYDALRACLDNDILVTDEAAAIEQGGDHPQMVEGHADNIKITRPEDLALASFYLGDQEKYHPQTDVDVADIDGMSADDG
jgi:2-C-methyl-D-erythritol 4-phosphate cytidylyltransferase